MSIIEQAQQKHDEQMEEFNRHWHEDQARRLINRHLLTAGLIAALCLAMIITNGFN